MRIRRSGWKWSATLLIAGIVSGLSLVPHLAAQAVNSSIEGLVQDTSGAVVPGASVILTNLATDVMQTTQTNTDGRYAFPAVPAGPYSLKVSKDGFNTQVISHFVVAVSQYVTENVTLEVGAVSQSVTVSAGGLTPMLQPGSSDLGTLITPTSVQHLPLNGRDFLQLGLLAGATVDSGTRNSDFVSNQTGHPDRAINVGGNEQDLTSYLINGMSTVGSRLGNSQLNLSVDAIDQFKVRYGFFLPDLGPDPGIVNVITKSGTNSFHGEAFEFLRNNALDARNFFDITSPPPFRRNQFGGSLGGPIVKDKVFFFGNYEGMRQVLTNEGHGYTPTAAMFNGDFSALLPNVVIYDPATYNPATGTRQAFSENIIPAGRINPVAKNLLAFYKPGSSLASKPFNFNTNVPTTSNSDQETIRVDANLSSRNSIFGQFTYEDSPAFDGALFPYEATTYPMVSTLAMVEWTTTLNPIMVNELRIGYSRGSVFQTGEESTNVALQAGVTGLADENGPPSIIIPGFNSFGAAFGPIGDIDNIYQANDGFNWLYGNHQIELGVGVLYHRTGIDTANSFARGTINFLPTYTAQLAPNAKGQPTPVAGTGSAFADFLLGYPFNGVTSGFPRIHYRWIDFSPYIQDTWKVRRNVTLNLGFGWFLSTPPNPVWPDSNRVAAFDFNTGLLLFSALGQVNPEVYPTDFNNFTPRFGLAWEPSFIKNTVVRGGFGVYYGIPRLLDEQRATSNPGQNIVQTFSNSQVNPFPTYVLGQNVFPPLTVGAITPGYASTVKGVISALSTANRVPYVEQWTFGIQHTFGARNLLEVDYLGSEAHKLPRRYNPLDCSVASSLICDPLAVKFPQYLTLLYGANDGNSNYQALVAKFQRQFSRGFSLLANYTWSKALTNSMESGAAGTLSQRAICPACDKGLASYNRPQRLVISSIYELPFGPGKQFFASANPVAGRAVGGWTVDFIATFAGGNPFDITSPNTTSSLFADIRANRLCNGRDSLSNKNLRTNGMVYFDRSCFVAPARGYFGSSAFDALTGPGVNNWDIAIEKNTQIRESLRLQFRSEFFNAFNHAQFTNPDSQVGDANFGRVISANPGREIQFGLKLMW